MFWKRFLREPDPEILRRLDRNFKALQNVYQLIERRLEHMTLQLDHLAQDVARNGTVIDSAVQLIQGLVAQVRDLKTKIEDPADQAKIDALADEIEAKLAPLSAAVQANTVADTPQGGSGETGGTQTEPPAA